MLYIGNQEQQPEHSLRIVDVLNLAVRFALSVSVGLVCYAYLWIW